jgi:hypothetical protein
VKQGIQSSTKVQKVQQSSPKKHKSATKKRKKATIRRQTQRFGDKRRNPATNATKVQRFGGNSGLVAPPEKFPKKAQKNLRAVCKFQRQLPRLNFAKDSGEKFNKVPQKSTKVQRKSAKSNDSATNGEIRRQTAKSGDKRNDSAEIPGWLLQISGRFVNSKGSSTLEFRKRFWRKVQQSSPKKHKSATKKRNLQRKSATCNEKAQPATIWSCSPFSTKISQTY